MNPKAFYLSTFFWLCRIWDCALLPFPHPRSSFGFHVFTLSPVLFLGSPPIPFLLLYSSPLLLFFPSPFSSPFFWRMNRPPGSAFSCLSYIFTLLFRSRLLLCACFTHPVLQSCVSSGLWNFSSCTLHKPPKTHCGQNWIYRWFCLQTDLVSLVFPHFCQRYWGIMISYQSLGIRILQCTSFVPSTNAVCRVSEFMPIYYNDSFQSMRHVHNWHHMQPVYGNMMDQRKNFRSKEKSWAWEQSISSESEEWKVCHILLFHS